MNILIIKLGALGDVVMATALIEAIQKHHPDADCHLLTTPAYAPLFAAWPALHVNAQPRRGWRSGFNVIRYIRQLRCEVLYDLQGNDRSGLWTALSGARKTVGNQPRYPYTHHPPDRWSGQCHIFDRMTAVLAAAGIDAVADRPVLPVDERDRALVAEWLSGHALEPGGFAILHAGASAGRPEKRWPYFAILGQQLQTAGICPVWIGAASERDDNARLAADAGGIDASGAFAINALAELGRHARFAITNDSGPMHVLAASAKPVYGLFGPSDWRRNHALGQAANVIACVETCAAYAGQRTGDCLDQISADDVFRRLSADGLV